MIPCSDQILWLLFRVTQTLPIFLKLAISFELLSYSSGDRDCCSRAENSIWNHDSGRKGRNDANDVENTIRDGGSIALYTIYTVNTVSTTQSNCFTLLKLQHICLYCQGSQNTIFVSQFICNVGLMQAITITKATQFEKIGGFIGLHFG